MKLKYWLLLGTAIGFGVAAVASTEKGAKRSRLLQLLSLLAGELVVSKRNCGSVAGVIATWIARHGSEWQRLLARQSSARMSTRERDKMEAAVTDILTTIDGCKGDPAVIEVLPRLLALMPPDLVTRVRAGQVPSAYQRA